ncbi:MAG: CvpA family protein [Planctomycetaceae bacterium]|nr:CvpA family protein [Planctomycetaceae bacterium]
MLFDGLVLALVALAAGFGAWKGFTRLAAVVVAPAAGFAAGWPLSAEFPEINRGLAFGLLYLLITLLVFVFAALARQRLERAKLEGWDTHLGLILGAAQGCVLAFALTLLALSLSGDLRGTVMSSRSGALMAQAASELRPLLTPGAADFLDPWLDLLQRRNA